MPAYRRGEGARAWRRRGGCSMWARPPRCRGREDGAEASGGSHCGMPRTDRGLPAPAEWRGHWQPLQGAYRRRLDAAARVAQKPPRFYPRVFAGLAAARSCWRCLSARAVGCSGMGARDVVASKMALVSCRSWPPVRPPLADEATRRHLTSSGSCPSSATCRRSGGCRRCRT